MLFPSNFIWWICFLAQYNANGLLLGNLSIFFLIAKYVDRKKREAYGEN